MVRKKWHQGFWRTGNKFIAKWTLDKHELVTPGNQEQMRTLQHVIEKTLWRFSQNPRAQDSVSFGREDAVANLIEQCPCKESDNATPRFSSGIIKRRSTEKHQKTFNWMKTGRVFEAANTTKWNRTEAERAKRWAGEDCLISILDTLPQWWKWHAMVCLHIELATAGQLGQENPRRANQRVKEMSDGNRWITCNFVAFPVCCNLPHGKSMGSGWLVDQMTIPRPTSNIYRHTRGSSRQRNS